MEKARCGAVLDPDERRRVTLRRRLLESISPTAMTTRSFRRSALLLILALTETACGGGTEFTSDWDPGADMTGYRTYAWAQRTDAGRENARVYNAVTETRVKSAVNKALEARGYERVVAAANPDFMVAWHGAIEGKVAFTTVNRYYGYGWGWYGYGSSSTRAEGWDEGTLVLDIVDAASNQLVWRGTAAGELQRDIPREERQARLDAGAERLLRTFPPEN
jgi:hypothetical protein